MLSRLPGGLSESAEAAPLLSLPDTVLTETTLPLASVTVVVTEPSALVVTLVVSLEELLPPDADAPDEAALEEADGAVAELVAPDALVGRMASAEETGLMLPLIADDPDAVRGQAGSCPA